MGPYPRAMLKGMVLAVSALFVVCECGLDLVKGLWVLST